MTGMSFSYQMRHKDRKIKAISSQFGNLCYSMDTMSGINRGIPEGITQKATIIDFEAAKGKRLKRETSHAKKVEAAHTAFTPLSPEIPTEADQSPQCRRRVKLSASSGKPGKIRPLAESTHTIIDLQKARINRILNEQSRIVIHFLYKNSLCILV
jgi:superfamily I DNA and RNA helicase